MRTASAFVDEQGGASRKDPTIFVNFVFFVVNVNVVNFVLLRGLRG
jgi:hypothetical protein